MSTQSIILYEVIKKLPNFNQEVLLLDEVGEFHTAIYKKKCSYCHREGFEYDLDGKGNGKHWHNIENFYTKPIYWMELPSIPEKYNDNTNPL